MMTDDLRARQRRLISAWAKRQLRQRLPRQERRVLRILLAAWAGHAIFAELSPSPGRKP